MVHPPTAGGTRYGNVTLLTCINFIYMYMYLDVAHTVRGRGLFSEKDGVLKVVVNQCLCGMLTTVTTLLIQ